MHQGSKRRANLADEGMEQKALAPMAPTDTTTSTAVAKSGAFASGRWKILKGAFLDAVRSDAATRADADSAADAASIHRHPGFEMLKKHVRDWTDADGAMYMEHPAAIPAGTPGATAGVAEQEEGYQRVAYELPAAVVASPADCARSCVRRCQALARRQRHIFLRLSHA